MSKRSLEINEAQNIALRAVQEACRHHFKADLMGVNFESEDFANTSDPHTIRFRGETKVTRTMTQIFSGRVTVRFDTMPYCWLPVSVQLDENGEQEYGSLLCRTSVKNNKRVDFELVPGIA